MKRLTMKDENGYYLKDKSATITWNSLIGENRYRGEAIDRLAAYENTGLEPEQVAFAKKIIEDTFSDKPDFTERLRELAEADREGRCVVLDVKIGQKVWILDAGDYGDDDEAYPLELNINGITLSDEHEIYYFIESPLGMDIDPFSHKDIGKTVFLIREEAEAALAKLNLGT